jgi:hypothetical protein
MDWGKFFIHYKDVISRFSIPFNTCRALSTTAAGTPAKRAASIP